MRRALALAAAAGLAAGCSKSSGEASAPPTPVVTVVVPAAESKPPPQPVPAPPAPVPFRYPDDAGGKAVAAALAPSVPPETRPAEPAKPKPRTSGLDRGEVPLPRVSVAVPKAPPPKAKPPKPTPPPERVPADLGRAAANEPAGVRLTERPLVKADSPPSPTAADVPPLARQLSDRASLDDPTAEIAAARVVYTPLPVPFTPGWFVRFTIPDPFELAEQMKAKTGASGELGTKPVDVPPARPK